MQQATKLTEPLAESAGESGAAAREPRPAALPHLAVLDSVRGAAILLVLVYHATLFSMDGSYQYADSLDGIYYRTTCYGWVGVDLFFVLSGFLITRILLASRGQPFYFRNFYARRCLRIFPLYYAALAAWTLAARLGLSNTFGSEPWLWAYASNLLISFRGWESVPLAVGHFWSLAVEEQFYLLWPLVVYLASERTLLRICMAMFVVGIGSRVGFVAINNFDAPYVFPLCRFDALLAGALFAILLRRDGVPSTRMVAVAKLSCIGGAFALAALILARGGRFDWKDPWVQTVGIPLVDLVAAGVLVLCLTRTASRQSTPWGRVLAVFGRYSYGLYVLQEVVFIGLGRARFLQASPHLPTQIPRQLLIAALGIGLTFTLALASWHLLEKRAIALKRYF